MENVFERKMRNNELVNALKDGTYIRSFDKQQSWYPKRKIFEKDDKALDIIFEKHKDADVINLTKN